MNANYAGIANVDSDASAFPGGKDLSGFPPTLLVNAENDTLRLSGELFGRELRAAGVDVTVSMTPDTVHGFLGKPKLPGFNDALEVVDTWLTKE